MSPIRRVREPSLQQSRFLLARCPHRAAHAFPWDQGPSWVQIIMAALARVPLRRRSGELAFAALFPNDEPRPRLASDNKFLIVDDGGVRVIMGLSHNGGTRQSAATAA